MVLSRCARRVIPFIRVCPFTLCDGYSPSALQRRKEDYLPGMGGLVTHSSPLIPPRTQLPLMVSEDGKSDAYQSASGGGGGQKKGDRSGGGGGASWISGSIFVLLAVGGEFN
jgi:uncharacterized membrane protein YgcG